MTEQPSFRSTDDARTGNSLRGNYRKLAPHEAEILDLIKARGEEILNLLDQGSFPKAGREFAIARTKIEEAVMWAVKGVTK